MKQLKQQKTANSAGLMRPDGQGEQYGSPPTTVHVTSKDILKYIFDNSPTPYLYVYRHFGVQKDRLGVQMRRLRRRDLIKRITPKNSVPLYSITKDGIRRLNYYDAQEQSKEG